MYNNKKKLNSYLLYVKFVWESTCIDALSREKNGSPGYKHAFKF
jgi:hypothetical protein